MNLKKRALGLSLGIVWGLSMFVWTILATMRGMGQTLSSFQGYYLGFSVSYLGSLVGLLWGFITGLVLGIVIAWLYNLFCRVLYKSEPTAG